MREMWRYWALDMTEDHLEDVAEELLDQIAVRPPISAFAVADWCNMQVAHRHCVRVRGPAMYYDSTDTFEQEEQIACGLAHWRLTRAGLECTDANVERVAHAIMLPRREFARDLCASRDWRTLQRKHRYTSRRFIEARLEEVAAPLQLIARIGPRAAASLR